MKRTLIVIAGIAVLAAGGAAIATAAGGDSSNAIPNGPDRERAEAVALQQTGGGRVTGTEVGDEEGAYEIEVTRPDGSQVDVHLDKDFRVLRSKADREDPGDR